MAGANILFYFAVAVLGAMLALQIFWRRRLPAIVAPVFYGSAAAVFAYLGYVSYLQYQAFNAGVLSQVLSTRSGFAWFFNYVRLHFLNEYLLSLLGALVMWLIAEYFNKRRGEVFFEREETYLAGLGAFLVGYPGWLFYLPTVLISGILASVVFVKKGERLPLYHFWLPIAIVCAVVIQFWAQYQPWWGQFRF